MVTTFARLLVGKKDPDSDFEFLSMRFLISKGPFIFTLASWSEDYDILRRMKHRGAISGVEWSGVEWSGHGVGLKYGAPSSY